MNDILRVNKDDNLVSHCIDWVSFSFTFYQIENMYNFQESYSRDEFERDKKLLDKLIEILGFSSTEITKVEDAIGQYRYGYWQIGEFIKILFGGAITGKGIRHNKLEMSGLGCRDFEKHKGNYYELFDFLNENGAKALRIDAATDVFTDRFFDMDKLTYYIENRSFTTPMKTYDIRYRGETNFKNELGRTIYIGSTEARTTLIRIYDKKLEMLWKNQVCFYEFFFRVEIEFHQERASWFMVNFMERKELNNDFSFVPRALYKILDFKDINYHNKNKSERPTADWWLEFINTSCKAEFNSNDKIIPSIEKNKKYLENNVARILSKLYFQCPNSFISDILRLVYDKSHDLEISDFIAINNYNKQNGLKVYSQDDFKQMKENLGNIIYYFNNNKIEE